MATSPLRGGHAGSAALIITTGSRHGEAEFTHAHHLLAKAGVPIASAQLVRDARRLPVIVRAALDMGISLLIMGGGDGTVNCAVDAVLKRGAAGNVVVGVLPLGTANDFARTLGLPFDLEGACTVIAEGQAVAVDVGQAGASHYINVASIGLAVEATKALSPEFKRAIGPLAYPLGAMAAFLRHRPFAATLSFPDGDHPSATFDRLLQIGVGNGRFYGGGMVVAPDAGIDTGVLDVYTLELGRSRDLLGVLLYLRSGDFIRNECVHYYRTRAVRIESTRPLPINIDGEISGHTPTDFAALHDAVHVLTRPDVSATGLGGDGS